MVDAKGGGSALRKLGELQMQLAAASTATKQVYGNAPWINTHSCMALQKATLLELSGMGG